MMTKTEQAKASAIQLLLESGFGAAIQRLLRIARASQGVEMAPIGD